MGGSSSGVLSPIMKPISELATDLTDAAGLTDVAGQKEKANELLKVQREANEAMLSEAKEQRQFEMDQAEMASQKLQEEKLAEQKAESTESAKRRQTLAQQQAGGRSSTILTSPAGVENSAIGTAGKKTVLGN